MPSVMVRAFDDFRASDAMTMGEASVRYRSLVSHVDTKLLNPVGVSEPQKPVLSCGNLDIAQLFANEFSALQVTYVELHSELRVGREMAAVCDFEAKLVATGQTVAARCSALYTLLRAIGR